ncbi:MAG: tryptophan synthase subunit alpha [Flavobacteriales bacterium]|nr:tryptophan synthase subunit alpha [Flavobacteriales bacterium]
MENKIVSLFQDTQEKVMSVYFTAGYPQLDDTMEILTRLQAEGVGLVEIGIPFSDPLADGETIQQSGEVALNNGMTLKLLLQQLKDVRSTIKIPLILMGYLNPIMQYGVEQFCKDCVAVGIDGVILPDLPLSEYVSEYKAIFEAHNLCNVCLITPHTSEDRIRLIDEHSSGFIYVVSSSSTTGSKLDTSGQEAYFVRVNEMGLKNPIMIGFGISDHDSFTKATQNANGAIIGSEFIRAVSNYNTSLEKNIESFANKIKGIN